MDKVRIRGRVVETGKTDKEIEQINKVMEHSIRCNDAIMQLANKLNELVDAVNEMRRSLKCLQ